MLLSIDFIEEWPKIVRELFEMLIFNIYYFLYSIFTDYQHGALVLEFYSVYDLFRFS